MTRSVVGNRLLSGGWHNQEIADRLTVRHGWAARIEVGTRADVADTERMPDGRTVLDYMLAIAEGLNA